jgi:outer membrane protein assembly factor BamB
MFAQVAFGGVTVVNDLLFTATLDGTVYALSRDDGSVVWQWQAPGGTNAWPAVVGDERLGRRASFQCPAMCGWRGVVICRC